LPRFCSLLLATMLITKTLLPVLKAAPVKTTKTAAALKEKKSQ
jgi:hypothetical protein